ncbi:MAG: hypothetical protein QW112_00945 [Candidatus Micrarchaeia archaeon]
MSRLIKLRLGLAAIIPEELSKKLGLQEGQEVIVKESKFGIFINPLRKRIPPTFSKDEVKVIDMLSAMKFAERTQENVNKVLGPVERKILAGLIEKGAVNLFRSQKYREGVYNIKDDVYSIIKKSKETTVAAPAAPERAQEKRSEPAEETDPIRRLERQGYVVIDEQNEARRLSEEVASRGKKKDVIGIRGFDKKYYILKASFYSKNQQKVKSALKEGKKSVDQIAAETGLDRQACIGILALLNEAGDVVEKRKGFFILAD